MEMIAQLPVTFTASAIAELKRLLAEEPLAMGKQLRVGVKGGGCSGMTYVLDFDEPKEGDDVLEINGFRVFMQKSHAIYLLGMEIDFVEGLNNRGFSFSNPNAKESCGCGTSFSA